MSKSKQSSLLLVCLLIAAILFFIYYFMVMPKLDEKNSLEHTASMIRQEIGMLQQQIDERKKTQSVQNEDLAEWHVKLPSDKGLVKLLLDLEQIGARTQSNIESLQFTGYDIPVHTTAATEMPNDDTESETVLPQLHKLSFIINVETTSEEHAFRFIKRLESLERIMAVDGIDLSLSRAEQDLDHGIANPVKATIQASAFYYQK